jgi:hypothetical protein
MFVCSNESSTEMDGWIDETQTFLQILNRKYFDEFNFTNNEQKMSLASVKDLFSTFSVDYSILSMRFPLAEHFTVNQRWNSHSVVRF